MIEGRLRQTYFFSSLLDQSKREESVRRWTVLCGSVIALGGFGLTTYLAMHGHEMVAMTVSLPLATILAIIVGNKVIGS